MAMTNKFCSAAGAGGKDGLAPASAWDWAAMIANATAGDVVWLRGDDTFSRTSSDTFAGTATATSPCTIRGATQASWDAGTPVEVSTTRGNGGTGLFDTTGWPVVNFTSSGRLTHKAFFVLRSVKITSAGYGGGTIGVAANCTLDSCVVVNSYNNSGSIGVSQTGGMVRNCDISCTGASATAALKVTSGWACDNHCTAVAGNGIFVSGTSTTSIAVVNNVVYAVAAHAILVTLTSGNALIYGNTCVDATGTSDGIHYTTGCTAVQWVIGNQVTDCGQCCIAAEDDGVGDNGCAIYLARNRLTRHTSTPTSGATDWIAATSFGNVTTAQAGATTADQRTAEYVSPGSTAYDYRLKPASYAIAANLNGRDIGAIQSVFTAPAAADVYGDAADYGYAGSLVPPTGPTAAEIGAAAWNDLTSPTRTESA